MTPIVIVRVDGEVGYQTCRLNMKVAGGLTP
jgi:hypothetical protein